MKHFEILIILQIRFLMSFANYYACNFEQCECCFIGNHWTLVSTIPNTTRSLIDANFYKRKSTWNWPNRYLKQITTHQTIAFQMCSQKYHFEKHSIEEIIPIFIETNQEPGTLKGLDKCLFNFCKANSFNLSKSLKCTDNTIHNLNINYVNKMCFSKIVHLLIQSTNLNEIANGGFLANKDINWNIISVQLEFAKKAIISIGCNAFQFLTKLRILSINVAQVPNFQCIFDYNPDIVKITWNTTRIWNMCNGSLDIWVMGKNYNKDTYTKSFLTAKLPGNSHSTHTRFSIALTFLCLIIIYV